MKPLIGGRLLSANETKYLIKNINNARVAVIDSMERDEVIKAIAKRLYHRSCAYEAGELSPRFHAKRTHSRGRGGFHFSDLYR